MFSSSRLFPFSVQDKLFRTERGDICLRLHEAWPALFSDLGSLGPVILVSRNSQMAVTALRDGVDFLPVAGGHEILDLRSGLSIDTTELSLAIAGKEAETGVLSLHFFDREGFGLLKVLLAPGADVESFMRLLSRYGKSISQHEQLPPAVELPARNQVVAAEERNHFQDAWATFDPKLGGDFLPGGRGVIWLDALRLAGKERAAFLPKLGLLKAILGAYHEGTCLRVTTWHGACHHEIRLTPRRIERCGPCFHLFDVESEAHFFRSAYFESWMGFHGEACSPAVHIFDGQGRRQGLVEFGLESPE